MNMRTRSERSCIARVPLPNTVLARGGTRTAQENHTYLVYYFTHFAWDLKVSDHGTAPICASPEAQSNVAHADKDDCANRSRWRAATTRQDLDRARHVRRPTQQS